MRTAVSLVLVLVSQEEDRPVQHVKTCKTDGEEDDEDAVNPGEFISVPVTRLQRSENGKHENILKTYLCKYCNSGKPTKIAIQFFINVLLIPLKENRK